MSPQRDDSGLHASEYPTSAGHAPQQVILGGNELRKRVGQGGMGEVWLAWDVKLHRNVALKTMRPDWAKQAESATRFYTEARSVAKLNHPNIVQIYQIGEDKGLLFFTMEWVDGKSLEAYLKEKGELEVPEALDLTLQMLEGLAFANKHQVIHRDVKPANCLLDAAGRLKLADFGLAKMLDSDNNLTSSGVSMGSPNYMSPEMAKGERADHRADMYAVGLTLYQMLTGKLAFSGPTATAVLLKQVNEDLPITPELTKKAGQELLGVIKRVCAKYPQERYATYEELIDILKRLRSSAKPGLMAPSVGEARTVQLESVGGTPKPDGIPRTWSGDAVAPTQASQQSVEVPQPSSLQTEGPRRKLPVAALAIGAILLLGGGGAFMMLQSGKQRPANAPVNAPAATTGNLRGEVAVTGYNTTEFAGEKVLLFDGLAKEQFSVLAGRVRDKQALVSNLQSELNSTLKQLEGATEMRRSIEVQNGERQRLAQELEKVSDEGKRLLQALQINEPALSTLKQNLASFRQLGHSSLPCIHPITQEPFALSATNNRKDESIAIAARVIQDSEVEITRRRARLEELTSEHTSKKSAIDELDRKIEALRGELTAMRPEELRTTFEQKFPALVTAQQELIADQENFVALLPTPTGETTVGANGQFAFDSIRPDDYLLLLDSTASRDGSTDQRRLVWVMTQPVKAGSDARASMSGSNLLIDRRIEAAPLLKREVDQDMLRRAITLALSPNPGKDRALPLAAWTFAQLED